MSDSSTSSSKSADAEQRTDSVVDLSLLFEPKAAPESGWLLRCLFAVLIGGVWLCSGIFVVGTDEAAVVRVFGRAERTADGVVVLRSSGLYLHLPWPMTQVERVRMNEVRTVTVGSSELDDIESGGDFLRAMDESQQTQLLSGDKNILNVQLNVSYRISSDQVGDWLFGSTAVERRLELLASSVLADVVLRSGVDFVHTLGHNEIRQAVLLRLEQLVEQNSLGIDVEDVTIASVAPPVRVKADFVDVMNARADRETYVNRARAYESQRESDAKAQAAKLQNEARSYARRKVDLSRAEAESFNRLVDQFVVASNSGETSYLEVRQMALRRQFIDTLQDILSRVDAKVVLDSGKQVDITLHRNPNGQ
jgi:modulator of FtsH protease HflK